MKIDNEYIEAAWVFGSRAFLVILVIVAGFILLPSLSWTEMLAAATAFALVVACCVTGYLAYRTVLQQVRERRRTAGNVKMDIRFSVDDKTGFHSGGFVTRPWEYRQRAKDGRAVGPWCPCSEAMAEALKSNPSFDVREMFDPYRITAETMNRRSGCSLSTEPRKVGKNPALGAPYGKDKTP